MTIEERHAIEITEAELKLLIWALSESLTANHRAIRNLEKSIGSTYYLETKNMLSKSYNELVRKTNELREMKNNYVKRLVELDQKRRGM